MQGAGFGGAGLNLGSKLGVYYRGEEEEEKRTLVRKDVLEEEKN